METLDNVNKEHSNSLNEPVQSLFFSSDPQSAEMAADGIKKESQNGRTDHSDHSEHTTQKEKATVLHKDVSV